MTASPGITLTGVDEHTPVEDILRLADLGAEIGILLTVSPDGRKRYPSLPWIADVLLALKGRAALHICGERARGKLFGGDFDGLLAKCGRVQINGCVSASALWNFCRQWPLKSVITQHKAGNLEPLNVYAANHALLVDGSAGHGKVPEQWVRPQTDKPVGFAGGLGPHTLRNQLPKIAAVARDPWWIDMEGRLRDADDWFSVERALDVIAMFGLWKTLRREAPP